MEWLNYHHLYYFWNVTKAGSISIACKELRLSQPTISAQIKALENMIGKDLFDRTGKRLSLTDTGQTVFRYADQIFGLGRELMSVMREELGERGIKLIVGIVDALPKAVAYRLLAPVLRLENKITLSCPEDRVEELLSDLAVHRLDLILADSPIPPGLNIKAYHHFLGESSISVFGTPKIIKNLKGTFPQCIDRFPFLLPAQSSLRRNLDQWFDEQKVRPEIVGEFADSALINMFGRAGEGLFAAPSFLDEDMKVQYGAKVLGKIESIKERYYAISPARETKHPAVTEIINHAKSLFK